MKRFLFAMGLLLLSPAILLSQVVQYTPLPEAPIWFAVPITNPGAGNNFSYTIPTGQEWDITAITFTLSTSGSGSSRTIRLYIEDSDGEVIYLGIPDSPTQGISEIKTYVFCTGCPYRDVTAANYRMAPLPSIVYIGPGCTIRSAIVGLQSGDTITGITVASRQGD